MSLSAVFVVGPAGNGKSTLCSSLYHHYKTIKRTVHVVNLDPAAENFDYSPAIDIRDLVTVEDVMEECGYGPNGGLVFCFEYLLDHLDWLEEQMGDFDDDFLIIDCPGQIELYTHFPYVKSIIDIFQQRWGYHICAAYLMESQFVLDPAKYISGVLSALSAMVQLEVPHLNILTKLDLWDSDIEKVNESIEPFLDPNPIKLSAAIKSKLPKYAALNQAILNLIDEFSMVQFLPFNRADEDSIDFIAQQIDHTLQISEYAEPKDPDIPEEEPDDLERVYSQLLSPTE